MMPVDDFVGPYLPPADLSLAALADAKKGAEGAFAAALATSGIKLKAATGELCVCRFAVITFETLHPSVGCVCCHAGSMTAASGVFSGELGGTG
jgi:hypothetical protein